MNVFQSIALGLLQGITEFLPISSSGHLILARVLFDIPGGSLMYDLILHAGTLLAVAVYLRWDILKLFKPPFLLLGVLVLATVPAGLVGYFFADKIESIFGNGEWLFVTFAITGVLLLVSQIIGRRIRQKTMGVKQGICMGIMQAFALLPGLSRSGCTVFGGIVSGGERGEVARFAFLMSMPIILGGIVLGISGSSDAMTLNVGWWETLAGAFASFVGGYFSVGLVDRVVKRANFLPFALYMFGLSVISYFVC